MKPSTKLQVVKPATPAKKRVRKQVRVGLMDPSFKYVPAASTNIAATFARVRAEMARKAKK